jgi:hypothetical protein
MRFLLLALSLLLASESALAANMRALIRNSNDRYLSAEGGGGSHIWANRVRAQTWERFLIVDLNGGDLMSGDTVCIETWNRHYIVAERGGGTVVRADRTACGPWEKFRIWKLGDNGGAIYGRIGAYNYIALQASNGNYVAVERDEHGSVMANRTAIGLWERFVLFAW